MKANDALLPRDKIIQKRNPNSIGHFIIVHLIGISQQGLYFPQ